MRSHPLSDHNPDTVPRLFSDFGADIFSDSDNIADASVRIFDPHIDDTAVIWLPVESDMYFQAPFPKLFPDIIWKNDIGAALFIRFINQRFVFVDFTACCCFYHRKKHLRIMPNYFYINMIRCIWSYLHAIILLQMKLYNILKAGETRNKRYLMNTILIIEDDKSLADGLVRALSSGQNAAESCGCLKMAREKIEQNGRKYYTLILLDANLPDGNGFDFLTELKKDYGIPVIMLTANDLETDIVSALEQGADDYITKPFSLAILRARVNAQLRRGQPDRQTNSGTENNSSGQHFSKQSRQGFCYQTDIYLFDFENMRFSHGENTVELSKTEQKLLRILTENAGITIPRSRLIDHVWTGDTDFVDENALSVAIKRLRDKLGAQDAIETVYGIGYKWKT